MASPLSFVRVRAHDLATGNTETATFYIQSFRSPSKCRAAASKAVEGHVKLGRQTIVTEFYVNGSRFSFEYDGAKK